VLACIQTGLLDAVAHVDGQAYTVHFVHGLDTQRGQAPVACLQAAVAQQVGLVVGQLEDAQPQVVEQFDALELVANRLGVLPSHDQTERAALFCRINVVRVFDQSPAWRDAAIAPPAH
jgi:hypothetical protein